MCLGGRIPIHKADIYITFIYFLSDKKQKSLITGRKQNLLDKWELYSFRSRCRLFSFSAKLLTPQVVKVLFIDK